MRTEREMTTLILGVAERDARVRAVFMNGSRANPNAPRDIFQDYDIVYVVEETASFRAQPGWVDVFGERLVMQTPDEMDHTAGQPTDLARCYGYLMQFADGNRIDLRLMTLPRALEECQSDSQTIVLLDKDGILPPLPLPSDTAYHIRRPDQTAFAGCCNEFWWTLPYVAKGLWRGRVTYALDTPECLRPAPASAHAVLAGRHAHGLCRQRRQKRCGPARLPARRLLGALPFHLCGRRTRPCVGRGICSGHPVFGRGASDCRGAGSPGQRSGGRRKPALSVPSA